MKPIQYRNRKEFLYLRNIKHYLFCYTDISTRVELEKRKMGGNYIYQHGKNVLFFFYNIAPKKIYETTSMDERREIFRVYIELCKHGF